ncbi:MAG: LEPR-XLL domain-containing protein [Myxococcales bacterium]|nr:LEPR-XLL domain-containing protein [Myxococcales bacterium]
MPTTPDHPSMGAAKRPELMEPIVMFTHTSSSRQTRLHALAGRARGERFEQLEPRVLLSGTETIEWFGLDVEVQSGSWIITFDEYLGDRAEESVIGTKFEAATVTRIPFIEDRNSCRGARLVASITRDLD